MDAAGKGRWVVGLRVLLLVLFLVMAARELRDGDDVGMALALVLAGGQVMLLAWSRRRSADGREHADAGLRRVG